MANPPVASERRGKRGPPSPTAESPAKRLVTVRVPPSARARAPDAETARSSSAQPADPATIDTPPSAQQPDSSDPQPASSAQPARWAVMNPTTAAPPPAPIVPRAPSGPSRRATGNENLARAVHAALPDRETLGRAIKRNPIGVMVVLPHGGTWATKSGMAGHLGMNTTVELAQLLAEPDVATIVASWEALRNTHNFFLPLDPKSNKAIKVDPFAQLPEAFSRLRKWPDDHFDSVDTDHLIRTHRIDIPLQLSQAHLFDHAYALMSVLPDRFSEVPIRGGEQDLICSFSPDDWFRAICLFRHTHRTGKKEQNYADRRGAPKDRDFTKRTGATTAAMIPYYMTPSEQQTGLSDIGEMTLKDAAEAARAQALYELRDLWMDAASHDRTADPTADGDGTPNDMDLVTAMNALQSQLQELFTTDHSTASARGSLRKELLPAVRDRLLAAIPAKCCQVISDVGSSESCSFRSLEACVEEYHTFRETDAPASTQAALDVQLNHETFKQLQMSFTKGCVADLPYDQALSLLGRILTPAEEHEDYPVYLASTSNTPLTPKPWQICDAAQMMLMSNSLLRGGIVGSQCGTGKTITTLLFIAGMMQAADADPAAGPVHGRPSLVVCPSNLITQWQSDARFFEGVLEVDVWFGDQGDQLNNTGSTAKSLAAFLASLHHPTNGRLPAHRHVIVTSYATIQARVMAKANNGCNPLAHLFGIAVYDEAHYLRNPASQTHAVLVSLQAAVKWFITATPMINKSADIAGFLAMMQREEWMVDFQALPEGLEYIRLYDGDFEAPAGLVQDPHCIQARMWIFDAALFHAVTYKGDLPIAYADSVLGTILARAMIRRTMASTVDVGGRTYSIGADIPAYQVITVEVAPIPAMAREYELHFKQIVAANVSMGFDRASYLAHLDRMEAEGFQAPTCDERYQSEDDGASDDLMDASPGLAARSRRAARAGRHRVLALMTFSVRLLALIRNFTATSARDVPSYFAEHEDLGLTWFMGMTITDPIGCLTENPSQLLRYWALSSPKLAYLTQIVREVVVDGKSRLIVLVNWPLLQWMVVAYLAALRFNCLSILSTTPRAEREQNIALFNNPHSNIDVLVLSFRTSAQGLNLQACCHEIAILDLPDNCNTIIQAIGRVHRIGQSHPQRVRIVTQANSYDGVKESRIADKMLSELIASMDHGNDTNANQLRENAEVMITRMLGQRCSRVLWECGLDRLGDMKYLSPVPPYTRAQLQQWLDDHVGMLQGKTGAEIVREFEASLTTPQWTLQYQAAKAYATQWRDGKGQGRHRQDLVLATPQRKKRSELGAPQYLDVADWETPLLLSGSGLMEAQETPTRQARRTPVHVRAPRISTRPADAMEGVEGVQGEDGEQGNDNDDNDDNDEGEQGELA